MERLAPLEMTESNDASSEATAGASFQWRGAPPAERRQAVAVEEDSVLPSVQDAGSRENQDAQAEDEKIRATRNESWYRRLQKQTSTAIYGRCEERSQETGVEGRPSEFHAPSRRELRQTFSEILC